MSMNPVFSTLCAVLFCHLAAAAEVKVESAWVRPTAPGQKVAGAFMKLTADSDMALVKGASPAARSVELHFMRMDGGMMEMRELKKIELPKDTTVSLEPGGLHIMLIGLKTRIKPGDKIPLSLTVKDRRGGRHIVPVSLDVPASAE